MSLIHFKYRNGVDTGTVFFYSSQIGDALPATHVQNEILSKVWRTKSGFSIKDHNRDLPFNDTATGSVLNYQIPSGTYTGSALATKMQSGMNSVGSYSDFIATYDATDRKFEFKRSSTATGLFSLLFNTDPYKSSTVAVVAGFTHGVEMTGISGYTSSFTALGGEHEIVVQLSSSQSVDSFVIHKHDFDSSTVIRLRGATDTATSFESGWGEKTAITLSATLAWNEDIISVEFSSQTLKAMQLYWYNRTQAQNDVGRLFLGTYFKHTYQTDNKISYRRKTIRNRSKQFIATSGATYFDKRNKIEEYEIFPPPLDEYYDDDTKTGYEAMLDRVGNDTPLYITFDSDLNETTVYGFFVGDAVYAREKGTTIYNLRSLRFREQK